MGPQDCRPPASGSGHAGMRRCDARIPDVWFLCCARRPTRRTNTGGACRRASAGCSWIGAGTGGPEECIRSGLHGAMCYVAGEVPRGRDRADRFRRSFPIAQLARTQDVGGCRAILPSIAGIREVVHEFERCRLVLPLSFRNSPPHGTDAGRRHHRRGSTRSPVCRASTSKSLSL